MLSDPATYLHHPDQIEIVETHLSCVFLAGRFAFKLKKPVCFDFVDFRPVEHRHTACRNEIRLNRRLAPDVYLNILPITIDDDRRIELAGDGKTIDWVLRMHRLPSDRCLDYLLRHRCLADEDLELLVRNLVRFYASLPPITLGADQYCRDWEDAIRANLNTLTELAPSSSRELARRVGFAQLRVLEQRSQLLVARVVDGRIVEGHGDLRPEHVFFDPWPRIIDCLEFRLAWRQLDALDDLSFLTMECAYLGAEEIGDHVVQRYCESVDDRPPPILLAFYQSYRATVRAKTLILQAAGSSTKSRVATDYLELAQSYLDSIPLKHQLGKSRRNRRSSQDRGS
jgi:aminoglycoside phosphotransferase family enzyme